MISDLNTKRKCPDLLGDPAAAPELPILLLNFFTAADRVILFFTCLENPDIEGFCSSATGIEIWKKSRTIW